MTIVEAAKELANNQIMIRCYTQYDEKKQTWVYTNNSKIDQKLRYIRPVSFPKEKDFTAWWNNKDKDKVFEVKKRILYSSVEIDGILPSSAPVKKYDIIKKAYEEWGNFFVMYFGAKGSSCNLFVGETLYKAGYNLISGGKYFSAKDIWEAKGSLTEVKKSDVKPGDIAAFNGTHVEIVTKVDGNSFCSIGAGRGETTFLGLRSGNGIEVCGFEPFARQRYIDNNIIKFRRVK